MNGSPQVLLDCCPIFVVLITGFGGGIGSPLPCSPPRVVFDSCFVSRNLPRSRKEGSQMPHGIAKLLPLIVPVKGETQ